MNALARLLDVRRVGFQNQSKVRVNSMASIHNEIEIERVVLLHGYAENSDSWGPLAADLMKDHTVVVPDLRGIGRSSKPDGGYDTGGCKYEPAGDDRSETAALG